jgi:hypothetical protein
MGWPSFQPNDILCRVPSANRASNTGQGQTSFDLDIVSLAGFGVLAPRLQHGA